MGLGTQAPFFIPFRDRITYLRMLMTWLFDHGVEPSTIYIVDNGSTYEETLDQLTEWEREGVNLIWLNENIGAWGLWFNEVISQQIGKTQRYWVSDPDVIPDKTCQVDLMDFIFDLMEQGHSSYPKIGLGLRIDDIPDKYPKKSDVIEWEKRWWLHNGDHPSLYRASVATTFALYNHFAPLPHKMAAGRTKEPNVARHLPWYYVAEELPPDEIYYYENAPHREGRKPGWGWNPLPGAYE